MPRLIRTQLDAPGVVRRRSGKGFRYVNADGSPADPQTLARIKSLVIPPAWHDVWINPQAHGHIQAVGTDAAGRRQYLYHSQWRQTQDLAKHRRVMNLATVLPTARERVAAELGEDQVSRERVLAGAFRLLDIGFFRVGGERYAEKNGSKGLATIHRDDVSVEGAAVRFEFTGKSGQLQQRRLVDPELADLVRRLLRRRDDSPELLAYRAGRRWIDVTNRDINEAVHQYTGTDHSAKDFRTWHGTVLMAVGLAVAAPVAGLGRKADRAVTNAVREVAYYLGNTPTVARASYIDPRVIEHFRRGRTISVDVLEAAEGHLPTHGAAERETVKLLSHPLRGRRASG